jgi:hypothetical protein
VNDELVKFDGADYDLGGSEDDSPEYKVSFWTWNDTSWFELVETIREADAEEVIDWARSNAHGRYYAIFARTISQAHDGRMTSDDVRLVGIEPTSADPTHPAWARRHTPEQGPATHP